MPDVIIRPQSPSDDAAVIEIRNRMHHDLPPLTLEDYRRWTTTMPEGNRLVRYVAEQDGGVVIGDLELMAAWFVRRPNVYVGTVEVDPGRRGQGIGSRLYQRFRQEAIDLGAVRVYVRTREHFPEAIEFFTHRGFTPSGHAHRISRLTVRNANLQGYEGIDEQLRREGIRIATLAEIGPEDETFLRALYRVSDESRRDAPHAEESEAEPFETWLAHRLRGPGKSPDSTWVALNGDRPVGVAILRRPNATTAGNSYTGVDRAYRGRGIARALKLHTIEWARRNGVELIYTGNDTQNHRMLDINVRLGYEALPAFVEMVWDVTAT